MPDLSNETKTTKTIWAGVRRGYKTRVVLIQAGESVIAQVQLKDGEHWLLDPTFPSSAAELLSHVYTAGLVEGRKVGIAHERARCLAHANQAAADERAATEGLDQNGSLLSACLGAIDAYANLAHLIETGEAPQPDVAAEAVTIHATQQAF